MSIKSEIRKSLDTVLEEFGIRGINYLIETPENENFGDYSSNISLVLSKFLKKNPYELALEIAKKLSITNISKIEAVKPGFINFWISQEYLMSQLDKASLSSSKQGFIRKKIMIEFTDPNPFKEFHLGHLYTNAIGESISRLLQAAGAEIKRANYQGDVGMHVAKAIYGIRNSKIKIENLEKEDLKKRIKFLGEAYAVGAKNYEENEVAKKEIEELNKKIYAKDRSLMPLYEKGRQWSLEYFETIYKRLGTKFDYYYFESEVGVNGLKLVKEYLKKGVFVESQGAVIFPGKKYGLHDRVFINSLGLPTYEAKDIGLAFKKYEDYKFDQSISITGNEIIGYFKVIREALKQINPELASKIKHLPHGMVRLPTGKMSSRSGNILTGEWLLNEAKNLLKSKYPEMEDEVLEKVAVASIKYALLKSSIGHDIEFNFEESINIAGNSGPYLQYTFARTQSVLGKAKNINLEQIPSEGFQLTPEESSLIRSIYRFNEVVGKAAENFAPNILCTYLFDLAQKFNLFYQKCKILGSIEQFNRLSITKAVGIVVENGLNLLGIQAPEKM